MKTSVRGACHHDCPDTCVWDVTIKDGTAIRLRGNREHPTTQGQLCPKVNRFLHRVYHPDRLLNPLRRVGPKGSGEFEEISWDEAISEIGNRLRSIVLASGPEAILPYSFDGTQGSIQKGVMADRFFNELGASDIRRDLCGVTAWLGAADTTGHPFGIDPYELSESNVIILWGTNTRLTNRHLWPTIAEAKAKGATVVVIDPIRTSTASGPEVDEFFQLKPGTDVALVLAMINVMASESLLDQDWIRLATTGAEELLADAQQMGPNQAALVTGISAERIRWLARTYVTAPPAAIRVMVGPEHREHGQDIMRAISILPALTGAWREVGGGLARSTQVYFERALNFDETDHDRPSVNMASLGAVLTQQSQIADAQVPIEALIVHNSNPAVICPDQNAVVAGLEREDLFCVVLEQFMTDTARYADIVLPATTQLEHLELMIAWGHLYLALNKPAIDPVGQSLPNTEIFRRLAAELGMTDDKFSDSDEDLIRQLLDSDHEWMDGISFEGLSEHGWQRLQIPECHRPNVSTPPETVDEKFQLGSLCYKPGTETPEGDPERAARLPLMLISRKQHIKFLNANYAGFPEHLPTKGEPFLEIHAEDAALRGISPLDEVMVFNDRGSLTLKAMISDEVQPGLVAMPFGWWHRSSPQSRGVNALTNATVGQSGRGSAAFHENLVEVVRA